MWPMQVTNHLANIHRRGLLIAVGIDMIIANATIPFGDVHKMRLCHAPNFEYQWLIYKLEWDLHNYLRAWVRKMKCLKPAR